MRIFGLTYVDNLGKTGRAQELCNVAIRMHPDRQLYTLLLSSSFPSAITTLNKKLTQYR